MCEDCGAALYFSARVAYPQQWCFPCASRRGLTRLADRTLVRNLALLAALVEPWWRWTVYLGHAAQWTDAGIGRRDPEISSGRFSPP